MALKLAAFAFIVTCVHVSCSQSCFGRPRSGPPAPGYVGPVVSPQYVAPAAPCDDYSALMQLVSLLGQNAAPPPPRVDTIVNSGNIIDKLIDALILTATQNSKPKPSPVIDISLLNSLLKSQDSKGGESGLIGALDGGAL